MTQQLKLSDLEKSLVNAIHKGTYTGVDVTDVGSEADWVAKEIINHRPDYTASEDTIMAVAKLIDPAAPWNPLPQGDWMGTESDDPERKTVALNRAREIVKEMVSRGMMVPETNIYGKPGYYEGGKYLGKHITVPQDTYIRTVTMVGVIANKGERIRFMTDEEYAKFLKKQNCKCPCHRSSSIMHITPCC